MSIFGFGKKKEETQTCCCGGSCTPGSNAVGGERKEGSRDYEKIAAYGVMTTPALVVDGQVVSYGKVLKKDEVIAILRKVRK